LSAILLCTLLVQRVRDMQICKERVLCRHRCVRGFPPM
jgi:hypothetical protein